MGGPALHCAGPGLAEPGAIVVVSFFLRPVAEAGSICQEHAITAMVLSLFCRKAPFKRDCGADIWISCVLRMRPNSKNAGGRRFSLSNTTLQHRFLAAIAIIMACSLALGCTLIAGYHRNLQANDGSIARLMAFREVMNAANRLSAERGPTNAVLGEEPMPDSPSRQRLRAFRAASDAALARVSTSASLAVVAATLRQRLTLARQQVDALSGLPFAARSNADIERVIEAMFGVFDASQPLIDAAMTSLLADDPALIGRALVARMLSDLREHAGRMGSHLVIPIAHA
ncbi:MAG TPA: nitrate- and nitrite sensing domain-containing protein, partial [Bosea sp. (in: a-proteobacteria)]